MPQLSTTLSATTLSATPFTPLVTRLQKMACQSIVNIFETGSVRGNYADVTLIDGDTGHLTYGRSQTTLGSGNLTLLLQDYVAAPGAPFADALRPYLSRVKARDFSLDHDATFRSLLKQAGSEPVMQAVQDAFFDRVYWQPAEETARRMGVKTALGMAIVYDGHVHGSFALIAGRTNQAVGGLAKAGEKLWMKTYVEKRDYWLSHHSRADLRKTAYRTKAFLLLIAAQRWELEMPFAVRGCTISAESMGLAWLLQLNAGSLGVCAMGDGGNYFPVRPLLNSIYGPDEVNKSLTRPGSDLLWKGAKIPCATIAKPGETWGRVRDLATWLGLDVAPDPANMTINLTRKK